VWYARRAARAHLERSVARSATSFCAAVLLYVESAVLRDALQLSANFRRDSHLLGFRYEENATPMKETDPLDAIYSVGVGAVL